MAPPLLDLRNVSVVRGERTLALDRVTLRVEAGEHVCILGPNGCGKSTLIKTLTRDCYPRIADDSSLSILGKERWNVAELRSTLGIVSPDMLVSCSSSATGRDVVLSGFFGSARVSSRTTTSSRGSWPGADAALARMGVTHLAGALAARGNVVGRGRSAP